MKETLLERQNNRIWEVDALRGILILCLLATHMYYNVYEFCIDGYYTNFDSYAYVNATDPLHFWFDWGEDGVIYKAYLSDALRETWVRAGVDGFFVVSGIACVFSRSNLTRGLKMLGGAMLMTAISAIFAWLLKDYALFIRFGALHCYAFCHLIYYYCFRRCSSKTLLVASVPIFAVGYYLRYFPIAIPSPLLLPFGIYELGVQDGDYWPLLPMLGWLLVGVVLGRKLYPERMSLWPNSKLQKFSRPFCFLGRHSGVIYLAQYPIYKGFFYGLGKIMHWL